MIVKAHKDSPLVEQEERSKDKSLDRKFLYFQVLAAAIVLAFMWRLFV